VRSQPLVKGTDHFVHGASWSILKTPSPYSCSTIHFRNGVAGLGKGETDNGSSGHKVMETMLPDQIADFCPTQFLSFPCIDFPPCSADLVSEASCIPTGACHRT
jgi:hypothetical protein